MPKEIVLCKCTNAFDLKPGMSICPVISDKEIKLLTR